jgi:LmbE family N-acetylglucosaminyl deacetylase
MKALVLVAHPDDCVIWAKAYMDANPNHGWTICYLTHWRFQKRGREIARYWRKRNIPVRFLGFKDHGRDLGTNSLITWPEEEAIRALQQATEDYDLLLTHGAEGEYGHPHHRVVHKAIKDMKFAKKIYFSNTPTDMAYPVVIEKDELPRHRAAIEAHAQPIAYYTEVS